MAACGGLRHIFEKPLPEAPALLESLSPWNHMNSMKSIDESSSLPDRFSQLHFQENNGHAPPDSSSSSSPFLPSSSSSSNSTSRGDVNSPEPGIDTPRMDNNLSSNIHREKNINFASSHYPSGQQKQYKHSESFSSMNTESLALCTERLGFESFDDVEDLLSNKICSNKWQHQEERKGSTRHSHPENHWTESKRSTTCKGAFPPPISCIGRSGKPWVCFKSYRQDGRFILKEIRIPTQDVLHASRENGRLRLRFIQSDDEILEGDEEENEDTSNSNDGGEDEVDHYRNGQDGKDRKEDVETT